MPLRLLAIVLSTHLAAASLVITDGESSESFASPRAFFWGGPIDFVLEVDKARIYDAQEPLFHFCDPVREDARLLTANRTVLVALDGLVGSCSAESAFLSLSDAGATAVLMYIAPEAPFADAVPGRMVNLHGSDVMTTMRAARSDVPLVEISTAAAAAFRDAVSSAKDDRTVRIEPDVNPWSAMYDSAVWVVPLRVGAPLLHFSNAVLAVRTTWASEPGTLRWGSTAAWVVGIELVAAVVLAACHMLGIYFGGSLLPSRVQLAMTPQLGFAGLASTLLLSRSWLAHAAALSTGKWQQPRDPMAEGWCLHAAALLLAMLDVVAALVAAYLPRAPAGLAAMHFVANLVCTIQFLWSCSILLKSHITPLTVRRMSWYIVGSIACMCMGLVATLTFTVSSEHFRPAQMLLGATALTYGRIGTSFFQIAVYAPTLLKCDTNKPTRVLPVNNSTNDNSTTDDTAAESPMLSQPALLAAEYTQLMAHNTALRAAAREAELNAAAQAAELKRFENAMGFLDHEIRNQLFPLTFIAAGMEATLLPQWTHNCHTILSAVTMSSNTLKHALDVAKWKRGVVAVDKCFFALLPLLHAAGQFARPRLCASPGVALIVHGLETIEPRWHVEADEQILKEAFQGLLSHAINGTAAGSVTLQVQFDRQGPSNAQLTVIVTDTGPGLTKEGLAQALIPFGQRRTGDGMQRGTGLELPLAFEMVVTGHGGSLVLTSDGSGMGSTATAVIPLQWREAESEPPRPPTEAVPELQWVTFDPAAEVDVLCVDDSALNRAMIIHMCSTLGLTYEVAVDGTGAVMAMEKRCFSLVTMDFEMKFMNGDEATEQACKAGYKGPIVMVSGNAFAPDVEATLRKSGITAFLQKASNEPSIRTALTRLGKLKKSAAGRQQAVELGSCAQLPMEQKQ